MADPRALGLTIALLAGSLASAADVAGAPLPSVFKDPTTGIELALVKGGCFQMGDLYADSMDGESTSLPLHEVCLDTFYIGKYEVTVGQWRSIMSSAPSHQPSCPKASCPVDYVTYGEIQEFIKGLNAKDGAKKYRLPTEAEWEYAARSGGKVERYSGGSDVESVSAYTCDSQLGPCPRPGGAKLPNGLGIYDMSGNVYEVTSDWLSETYYSTSPRDNPTGPASGTHHVKRGGCASGGPFNSRVARRTSFEEPMDLVGFRLVRVVP